MTKPRVEIKDITPALAKRWLEASNIDNRKLRSHIVDKYAKDIANGNWQVGSSAISFDVNGRLANGQHRLAACVQANTPFTTIVITGVAVETFETEDTGLRRNLKDALDMRGAVNTTSLGAALNLSYRWYEGTVLTGEWPSISTALRWFEVNPGMPEAVRQGMPFRKPLGFSLAATAAFVHQVNQMDHGVADEFLTALRTGSGLVYGNPIFALRKWAENAASRRAKPHMTHYLAALVKGWNGWVEDQDIKVIQWRRQDNVKGREGFPELLDLDGAVWTVRPELSVPEQFPALTSVPA